MPLDTLNSHCLARYAIVMDYEHKSRLHLWQVIVACDGMDNCCGSGTSDDEEEAFQCAAMFRAQLADADAEEIRATQEIRLAREERADRGESPDRVNPDDS